MISVTMMKYNVLQINLLGVLIAHRPALGVQGAVVYADMIPEF